MKKKIKMFLSLKPKDKIFFVRTYFLCGYYRFVMLFVPFQKLAKKMGVLGHESHEIINKKQIKYVLRVRKYVTMAGKNTPWESLCLVQALTAQRLLNNRQISSTIYFGLGKDADGKPIAHAWLKHGGKIVVGENGVNEFSVVAMFGSEFKDEL